MPSWKLVKGPSNPRVVVGSSNARNPKPRDEEKPSFDVESKTSTWHQNVTIEKYWNEREGEGATTTTSSVTIDARVALLRNKTNHRHFESQLEDVLRDPEPPRGEGEEGEDPTVKKGKTNSSASVSTWRGRQVKDKEARKEEEEEEEEEEEVEEREEREEEGEEEDEDVQKLVEELKRLRAAADGEKSYKTWYFPPGNEYGSFLPNKRGAEIVKEIEAGKTKTKVTLEEDEREWKRAEKAKQYAKSRNLETHELW